jgi:3-deoxy-manno-octulosonate cytidylyltransferase (CMP-KDO synthetase)
LKTIIVIPARYKSTRFPGKPLIKLLGKPMIQWVAELSSRAIGQENVYIATENNKIFSTVVKLGFKAIMTSKNCLTGTDRLAEVAKKIKADIYVNVQGDEPLVDPKDIQKIINTKKKYNDEVINAYTIIKKDEKPSSINIPKVIFTENKRLIYISRKAIPGFKEKKNKTSIYYKQVCIYAYNRKELIKYGNYGRKSRIEQAEDIEILRFFEWRKSIRLIQTSSGTLAVDDPKDVKKVEEALRKLKIE